MGGQLEGGKGEGLAWLHSHLAEEDAAMLLQQGLHKVLVPHGHPTCTALPASCPVADTRLAGMVHSLIQLHIWEPTPGCCCGMPFQAAAWSHEEAALEREVTHLGCHT